MAASPMILFPCISTLFTVNLNGDLGAHDGTQSTARALTVFYKTYRPVSTDIVFSGRLYVSFFACMDAQMTFLSELFTNNDLPFQMTLSLCYTSIHRMNLFFKSISV